MIINISRDATYILGRFYFEVRVSHALNTGSICLEPSGNCLIKWNSELPSYWEEAEMHIRSYASRIQKENDPTETVSMTFDTESKDDTLEEPPEYPNINMYHLPKTEAAEFDGEYVCDGDCDCEFDPDELDEPPEALDMNVNKYQIALETHAEYRQWFSKTLESMTFESWLKERT